MRRRFRIQALLPSIAIPTLFLCVLAWMTCARARQLRLDGELAGAVHRDDTLRAVWLLNRGADPNARYNARTSRPGLMDAVCAMIGRHAQQQYEYPVLLLATRHDNIALVQALLAKGADVNAQDGYGTTALKVAAVHGNEDDTEIASLLLQHGAGVNLRNSHGDTALLYGAQRADDAFIAMLLRAGAEVNVQDTEGDTPLIIAAAFRRSYIPLLLMRHADVNACNRQGMTPLMELACAVCSERWLRLLLSHGARVNARNATGETALKLARMEQRLEYVPLLKQAGAKE